MKICLCFMLITITIGANALVTEEQKARMNKLHEECKALSGVTPELIEKVKKGEISDSSKLRQHAACFAKKAGVMTEAGDLQVEVIRAKLRNFIDNDEKVNTIVTECCVKKDTPEDTAYHMFSCLRKDRPTFTVA